MATVEQEQQQQSRLRESLGALKAIEPESLVRTDVLGKDLNFAAGLPVFQRTLDLFQDLADSNFADFPFESLHGLAEQAKDALSLFQQIQNFSLQQHPQNPVQARDNLIAQLRDRWNQYYNAVTPHIAYAYRKGTDLDTLEREARGTLALLKQVAGDFQKEKDNNLADMQDALKRVRQAAAEAGVAQHAIHFKNEADYHKRQSFYWLAVAFGLASCTIAYALLSLGKKLAGVDIQTISQVIQLLLPRAIVIFVLTFGLVWAIRMFTASRHNFVVNRHRQNALSSFETFVKGASGTQTKDAVLLQATQSIFAPQDSGFTGSDVQPLLGSQIVEVVRGPATDK